MNVCDQEADLLSPYSIQIIMPWLLSFAVDYLAGRAQSIFLRLFHSLTKKSVSLLTDDYLYCDLVTVYFTQFYN